MKKILILLLVSSLFLGLGGCQTTGTTKTVPIKTDVATLTQDEVCALVYNYLENKVASVSAVPRRLKLLDTLGKARPYFQAVYQGNGKWQVSAIGYGVEVNLDEYKETLKPEDRQKVESVSAAEREQWVKEHEQWFLEQHFPSNPSWVKTGVYRMYYYRGGLWSVYEASGVIEPANEQASELLRYIQSWTITKIEGKETTPTPSPTPAVVTTLYTSPMWGYSIQVVQNWKVDDTEKDNVLIYGGQLPAPGVVQIFAKAVPGYTLESWVDWVMSFRHSQWSTFQELSRTRFVLPSGLSAYSVVTKCRILGEEPSRCIQVLTVEGGRGFEVKASSWDALWDTYSMQFEQMVYSIKIQPTSTPIPTPTPTSTPTPTPTGIMPERTALIGGSQYPKPGVSPVLTSSNWVVSRFETSGELPTVPNSLLPLFRDVKGGDRLPLNVGISIPSAQFWNGLLPSEKQTMLDIVEWYGMPAKDYLWWIAAMTPGRP